MKNHWTADSSDKAPEWVNDRMLWHKAFVFIFSTAHSKQKLKYTRVLLRQEHCQFVIIHSILSFKNHICVLILHKQIFMMYFILSENHIFLLKLVFTRTLSSSFIISMLVFDVFLVTNVFIIQHLWCFLCRQTGIYQVRKNNHKKNRI